MWQFSMKKWIKSGNAQVGGGGGGVGGGLNREFMVIFFDWAAHIFFTLIVRFWLFVGNCQLSHLLVYL